MKKNTSCKLKKSFRLKIWKIGVWILLVFAPAMQGKSQESRLFKLNIRGVYDAKVSLTPYEDGRYNQAIQEIPGVKGSAEINVPGKYLPGQFLLRMDYRQKSEDQPYPAEFVFFMNREDLVLGINPLAVRPDSIDFGSDQENPAYFFFQQKNNQRRQQLALLEQLLAGYDSRNGKFFKAVTEEFEKRRAEYNQWISDQEKQYGNLFISSTFSFQKVPVTRWDLPEEARMTEQAVHYFDEIDLNDPLILRTQEFNDFVTAYMRMFGMKATSEQLRDSLFTYAGALACEKAASGHPKVYGWMVDYFYKGYETYNIASGIKMLEKHIQNPHCLTAKKQEIIRRLEGMEKLTVGTEAPSFEAEMVNNMQVRFQGLSNEKTYGLLIFYNSECSHCAELLETIKKWYDKPENKAWFDVISVGVDDDRELWKKFHLTQNYPWTDVWAPGGINSRVATEYYILATPVMFLVDSDKKILLMPESVEQIQEFLNMD